MEPDDPGIDEIIVEQACSVDAPGIINIWNPMIYGSEVTFNSVEKTENDIIDMISTREARGYPFLVARDQDVLGFATFDQFRGGVGYRRTMEHTIMIGPGMQSRGIGRLLMFAVEDAARNINAHSLIGCICGTNQRAIKFHEALGYDVIGCIPGVGYKFGKYFDLVLVQKFLTG